MVAMAVTAHAIAAKPFLRTLIPIPPHPANLFAGVHRMIDSIQCGGPNFDPRWQAYRSTGAAPRGHRTIHRQRSRPGHSKLREGFRVAANVTMPKQSARPALWYQFSTCFNRLVRPAWSGSARHRLGLVDRLSRRWEPAFMT